MAVNNQNVTDIPKHNIKIKADTKSKGVFGDLAKGVVEEVIVPKSKGVMRDMSSGIINMLGEALRNYIDRVLYPNGDAPNRQGNSMQYTGQTNYTSFSRPLIGSYQPRGKDTIGQRPGNDVKFVWVESEDKAKQIIGALKEDIENYGKAKVASLYEMIGERTTYADFTYGWTDSKALGYYYDVNRTGSDYKWFLDLSKPIDITNV